MHTITLTPLTGQDASALLAFEVANRAWFESWVNARAPAYYSLEGVQAAIDRPCMRRSKTGPTSF